MNEQHYDIIVAGGGLAGLTLAIQCVDAGYNVALFEKEVYPFHKVCGEYISFESLDFLERLGINIKELHLPTIKKLILSDIKGRLYQFKLPLGGFGISRFTLDNLLYRLALQKGVHVFTNNKVQDIIYTDDYFKVYHSNGISFAPLVAGAFGKRSNIDVKMNRSFTHQKASKLDNYIGVKYHIKYHQPEDTIALHNFDDGYCGISKIENNICCLCYLTTAQNLKRSNNSINQMEEKILQKNPRLKEIFASAEFIYQQPLIISQVSFTPKTQVENHLLMAGDTAGMITPLCGNGMSMAMHASKIAFECIDDFMQKRITRHEMEERYTLLWRKQFSNRLWMGRTVQRLFGNTSSIVFLKMMKAFPFIAKQVIKQTHGTSF